MKAHLRAQLLRDVAHLRAAEQHVERPAGRRTLAGHQVLDHRALLGVHLVIRQRSEAIACQSDVANGRGLTRRGRGASDDPGNEREPNDAVHDSSILVAMRRGTSGCDAASARRSFSS